MRQAIAAEAAKATPPIAVAAWTANDLLIWLSVGYVILQTAYLVWQWRKQYRASK